MNYATPEAFRTALEARLALMARQDPVISLMRLRKIVVFDRILARLLVAAPGRWVLKGGVALEFRLGEQARTTKDLDLAYRADEEQATADLVAAAEIDLGDFFTFAVERTDLIDPVQDQSVIRCRIRAELADRRFDHISVDIGIADRLPAMPDFLEGPDLLGFAGIARIETPTLPLAQQLSEKAHAYTRIYRDSRGSSRTKDLVDIVLIRSIATFHARNLRQALETTFITRGTHSLPAALPPPPKDWAVAYRSVALDLGLDPDVVVGHRLAAEFLDPILNGTAIGDERWDPANRVWAHAGDRSIQHDQD